MIKLWLVLVLLIPLLGFVVFIIRGERIVEFLGVKEELIVRYQILSVGVIIFLLLSKVFIL